MADDVKQVKVDNWGIYFLQRLKHFFNRTDYCDLTLQFQDNAQLKVHRLVLSACTEYFEVLERTCEMYEDCLVMPDDLQADIVVPIVNFMYTGQLEFKMDILDKLHQCSEIMNMPVLTKLLDSHRPKPKIIQNYSTVKQAAKQVQTVKSINSPEVVATTPVTYKRSHNKAFQSTTVYRNKKVYLPLNKPTLISNGGRTYREPALIPLDTRFNKKVISGDPRPTRYELPEELDSENIFENSFCNISYTSQPLMVHPETRKQYSKRPRLANEASGSKKFASTVDILEHKKPSKPQEENLFEDSIPDDNETFPEQYVNLKTGSSGDPNQLFDQILETQDETKLTIETKNDKSSDNLDHAKIISEVLKKYPHLVKSNKNIKLKILNTTSKNVKKQKHQAQSFDRPVKSEIESNYTFETDILDSKQAAKLIAMGAENIDGPWICLICGTPGKAMNFTSYYKFRRHLVTVHNEKPVLNICEYCGHKSSKRNYIMHHMYTKHGVQPPPQYNFPKCNHCNYIALTEALLVKHKASHTESKNFRCNVCPSSFHSSNQLLMHIQNTGHKYSADRKSNLQCIYCQKVFMRENNLYAHLNTHHRKEAVRDGIIDDFDHDGQEEKRNFIKSEPITNEIEFKNYRCNVCPSSFHSSNQLLLHIQNTGHKYSAERKSNLQCIYCQRVFMRENNLYAHINTHHRKEAIRDGIIDDFDHDGQEEKRNFIESEPSSNDFELDIQYQIQQRPDGNITVVTKKVPESTAITKQKILNAGLSSQTFTHKNKTPKSSINIQNDYIQEIPVSTSNDTHEEIVVIDDNEYIMKDNQLIPRRPKVITEEYILSDHGLESVTPESSVEFTNIQNANMEENLQHTNLLLKDSENLTQSIPIYVSNEEEYKAIMSSNQPIIFDSGDSNKTLTVLSAPHTSTLETTAINLNTTQSNDVMIIQDEYPLNVSEAVAPDNSNIVVVYSHQVGDQSKQYQLLTTQALGAQFVPSSSIITQNYETVTTASVMNLENQETWQSNLQQIINTDQIEITPVASIQSIVEETDQVQVTNNLESENDVCDLPQVELSSNVIETNGNTTTDGVDAPIQHENMIEEQISTAQNLDENIEQECLNDTENVSSMDIIEEGPVEETTENLQNISSMEAAHENPIDETVDNTQIISSMEIFHEGETEETVENVQNIISSTEVVHGGPVQEIVDSTKDTDNNAVQNTTEPDDVISKNHSSIEDTDPIESQTYTQPEPVELQTEPNTEIVTENTKETVEQSEQLCQEQPTTIQIENIQKNEVEPVSMSKNLSDVSISTKQIVTEDKVETVQTLASEWSEEDRHTNKVIETPNISGAQVNDRQDNSETCELEESIENIQQEVDKQMATGRSVTEQENDDEMSDIANSSQDELENIQESPVTVVTDPAVAQEKISSLLNDWEDNDSQEDGSSATETVTTGPDEVGKSDIQTTETESPIKQDKIKSLVSDWDEDEEENKD